MGILDYMGKTPRGQSRVERQQRAAAGKTPEETRQLEQEMLQPGKLPAYTGPKPGAGPVEERTVAFFFESQEDVALLKKHVKVNAYNGLNTRDVRLFVAVLDALESGSLQWDKETDTLYATDDRNERHQL